MKRSRPSPQSVKRRAANAELAEAREAVEARARGLCELNTPACPTGPHRGTVAHHRLMRSHTGKHEPELMAWTCDAGHRWTHDHPAVSYERGWLVRGNGPLDR